MPVVTLAERPPRAVCGGKFAGLEAADRVAPVPRAVCLTVDEFERALGPARLRALGRLMDDVRSTVGAFLPETDAEVARILRSLSPTPSQRQMLAAAVEQVSGPARGFSLAVRSSAIDEDSAAASRAGIYTSVLGVGTAAELAEAVVACWRSFYGPAALAARVRTGDFDPAPRMAVVVQQMVEPEVAGVAFTAGRQMTAEYVHGRADALVAGAEVPERVAIDGGDSAQEGPAPFLAPVYATTQRLREAAGLDVDVEWAWAENTLWVLQCRPVSAQIHAERSVHGPHLAYCRLYLDDVPSKRFSLGAAAPIWASYVGKRAVAYRLAHQEGIRTGAAFAVSLNGAALVGEGARERLRSLADELTADRVVIDVAPTIRQIVTDRDELLGQLRKLLHDAGGSDLQGCIVRDYLRGSFGALSMLDAQGGTLVELSPDGLLALNRGTAASSRIYASAGGALPGHGGEAPAEVRSALPVIAAFTGALNRVLPDVQLEWVIEGGQAVFVDYSTVRSTVPRNATDSATAVVSGGVARGPILAIGNDAVLERLSIGPAVSVDRSEDVFADRDLGMLYSAVAGCPEKPIVVASAPYAALSVLIDRVAGFVFERGAVLSHLGILLREARLPAIIHPDPPRSGAAVIADGSLSLMAGGVPT
jgi:hypothetical protein